MAAKLDIGQYIDETLITQNVTILSGQSLSGFITLGQTLFVGYIMPAAWTAANLTFQASTDDSTFFDVFDNFGNEVQHIVDIDRYITLEVSQFPSIRALKIRSGTSAAPVNQGADRTIQILSKII
jgi:hypothetical protein